MLYFVKNIHKITKLFYNKGVGLEALKTSQRVQDGSQVGWGLKLVPRRDEHLEGKEKLKIEENIAS